jgi:hypothetical protein
MRGSQELDVGADLNVVADLDRRNLQKNQSEIHKGSIADVRLIAGALQGRAGRPDETDSTDE